MQELTRRSFLPVLVTVPSLAAALKRTRNVILVMTDGLRWQEVFQGADRALMNRAGGVSDVDALTRQFWREDPAERREALMPFLWRTVARDGQIFGNRELGAESFVTNGLNFSYPGYSETLCGFPDPRIDSNDKIPNPNVTVLEWLQRKPSYRGKVAALAAWDVFPFILNAGRAGFPVNAGYEPLTGLSPDPRLDLLNRLKAETRVWEGEPLDAFTFHTALEYLQQRKPRVLFLSLGETDEWAHGGKYDLYLGATRRVDRYLEELWTAVQSMREYRGTTSLIFSCDHGRGSGPAEWKSHGEKIPESKYIWMAFLGPDTPPLGERRQVPAVKQSQIAATLAALLGEDYRQEVSQAGPPISAVLSK